MSQYASRSRTAAGHPTNSTPARMRITSDAPEDDDLDVLEEPRPGRMPSSARRLSIPARVGAPTTSANVSTPPRSGRYLPAVPSASIATPRGARRVRFHWLVFVGLAMFIMIIG